MEGFVGAVGEVFGAGELVGHGVGEGEGGGEGFNGVGDFLALRDDLMKVCDVGIADAGGTARADFSEGVDVGVELNAGDALVEAVLGGADQISRPSFRFFGEGIGAFGVAGGRHFNGTCDGVHFRDIKDRGEACRLLRRLDSGLAVVFLIGEERLVSLMPGGGVEDVVLVGGSFLFGGVGVVGGILNQCGEGEV